MNSRAARIGPMVCELEGPIPTLKMSKTLRVMGANLGDAGQRLEGCAAAAAVCNAAATPTCFAATSGGSNATPEPAQLAPSALVGPLHRPRCQCGGDPHALGEHHTPRSARRRLLVAASRGLRRAAALGNGAHRALELERAA